VSGRKTVRDRWYAQIVKTKAINGACRLLLMHVAACHMDETGRIGHMDETTGRFRGVRHEQLAEELGWGKRQRVSERYGEAIKAGLLKRSNGGYNGCPTVYDAKPRPDEGTQSLGTFRPVTVPSRGEPSEPTKVPSHRGPSDGKGPGQQVPPGWGPSDGAEGAEGPQPLGHIRARVTHKSRQDQPTSLNSRVSPTESAGSEERSYEMSGQPTRRSPLAGGPDAEVVREPGTALARGAAQLAARNGGDPAAMEQVLARIAARRGADPDAGELLPADRDVEDTGRRAALDEVTRRRAERERLRQEAAR
jgi:hypothetical protein